jgi:hypothetical protein
MSAGFVWSPSSGHATILLKHDNSQVDEMSPELAENCCHDWKTFGRLGGTIKFILLKTIGLNTYV